ncbi:MAG: hypothetical protein GX138_07285 [Firmicutes bacterium]|nr:hypothetical protein [Bacillota bacterium]
MRNKFTRLLFLSLLLAIILPYQHSFASTEPNILWLDKDYDSIDTFSEGLAIVIKDDKWGYIDTKGQEVIPLEYNWANSFDDGLALVAKGDDFQYKYGYIDQEGNEVVPLIYDWVGYFREGLAAIEIKEDDKVKTGFVNKKGEVVIDPVYDLAWPFLEGRAAVEMNEKWGYIDTEGNLVVPFKYDWAECFYNGYAAVAYEREGTDYFTFVDKNGKELFPAKYQYAHSFHEGLAVVGVDQGDDRKYGVIDTEGNEVVLPVYDWINDFQQGLSSAESEGRWGLINKEGRHVTPIKYDYIYPYLEDYASAIYQDKWGFLDLSGNEVIPFEYDLANGFIDGLALVGKGEEYPGLDYGYVDKYGNEVVPLIYDYASVEFSEGLAAVSYKGYWGFIDESGNTIVDPQFDFAFWFEEGLAIVEKDFKYGILKNPLLEAPKPKQYKAMPTKSKILVDGAEISFDAYLINDNNYFKLRDLAAVLSGSPKQFQVGWDDTNKVINLESNKAYTPVGGELALGDGKDKTALLNTSTIFKDGKEVELTAYNIKGNNYFKLRDLGASFDFGVEWDPATKNVMINSSSSYVE